MKFFIQKGAKNEIDIIRGEELKMMIVLTDSQIKDLSNDKTVIIRD